MEKNPINSNLNWLKERTLKNSSSKRRSSKIFTGETAFSSAQDAVNRNTLSKALTTYVTAHPKAFFDAEIIHV